MANFGLFLSLGLALAVAYGNIQGSNDETYLKKISPELLGSGSELRTILVTVRDDAETSEMKKTLFSTLKSSSPASPEERGHKLTNLKKVLSTVHSASQKGVMSFLEKEMNGQFSVEPLWITNKIVVRKADSNLIHSLARLQDVQAVDADKIYQLDDPIPPTSEQEFSGPDDKIQWGVQTVDAPYQWSLGNEGQGVLVGIIDTGVRVSHEALTHNYQNDEFSWFDPSNASMSTPSDEQGHGTHCAGSIVGTTQGIGVARQAKWMACRGCQTSGCSGSDLLACGQFMACPTTADGQRSDCSKAPHIVSCSWGGLNALGTESFYDEVIQAWRAANIVPVFALGNSGQTGCKSTGYPGDSKDVIGIGASSNDSTIASFSSLGPTKLLIFFNGRVKPDFSAPGKDIYSAGHETDTGYVVMSGTSMATPHSAGVIALMLSSAMSKNKTLTYDQVYAALIEGSQPAVPAKGRLFKNCGFKSETKYPNNHAGYGILNATKAIDSLNKAPSFNY